MSAICIPLMFSQKTKASKPHNALENRRQSSSSLGCSWEAASDTAAEWGASSYLQRQGCCSSFLQVTLLGGEGKPKRSDKPVTSYRTPAAANPAA